MNDTERRMWFSGIWTKGVIGIQRTNERRPYHDANGKRVKSCGFVWMSCRPTLDRLWFNGSKYYLMQCKRKGVSP